MQKNLCKIISRILIKKMQDLNGLRFDEEKSKDPLEYLVRIIILLYSYLSLDFFLGNK